MVEEALDVDPVEVDVVPQEDQADQEQTQVQVTEMVAVKPIISSRGSFNIAGSHSVVFGRFVPTRTHLMYAALKAALVVTVTIVCLLDSTSIRLQQYCLHWIDLNYICQPAEARCVLWC